MRPDTGTRTNMIMEMAAAIIESKANYCDCVADQFKEKNKLDDEAIWRSRAVKMRETVEVIDKNAGCWN